MPRKNIPVTVPTGFKWCWHYRDLFPVSEFQRDPRKPDGLRSYCRRANTEINARAMHKRKLEAAIGAGMVQRQRTGSPAPSDDAAAMAFLEPFRRLPKVAAMGAAQ